MKMSIVLGNAGLVLALTFGVSKIALSQDLAADGKKMYEQECVSCHLANGAGTGMYPAINKLSEEETLKLMQGYKDGSYGGNLKAIMEPFVKSKTDQQIKALVAYMATLK